MRALSLEYHDVIDGDDFDSSGFPGAGPASYKLTLPDFEGHLAAIAAHSPVHPGRVTDWLDDGTPARPLFLTFDDGGRSALWPIAESLERYGWRGHFFVTAGRIGAPTFLSAAGLRTLHERGHVIGTHSLTHPARMGGCAPEWILDEWRRSTAILADVLGVAVEIGSVPGGFYTRRVGEAASEAGLRVLFCSSPTTRCHRVAGCLVMGRFTLRRWSSASAAGALAGGRRAPRAGQWLLYSGLTALRTVAGDHYTTLRNRLWGR